MHCAKTAADSEKLAPSAPIPLRVLPRTGEGSCPNLNSCASSAKEMAEKVKVSLRDSTMKASKHWLEIERDGGEFHVALRNDKGVIGADGPTAVSRELLEHLAESGAGVIIRNEPLSFYKTEDDVRVSFIENTDEDAKKSDEPLGFDRLDVKEFDKAVVRILGKEGHSETAREKKRAASKPKRHAMKSSKRAK